MQDHRVRLDDQEVDLIVAALRARLAMTTGKRRQAMERLAMRLSELSPGNPNWRLSGEIPAQVAS